VCLFHVTLQNNYHTETKAAAQPQRGVPQRAQEGVPRRAQIARNQRNRMRQNAPAAAPAAAALPADSDNEDDVAGDENTQRVPQGAGCVGRIAPKSER